MHYYSLNDYLKNEYGEKMYKLSLSTGCSCPNRDGTLGRGGCIFCSNGGSGEFAAPVVMTLDEQLEFAKEKVNRKAKGVRHYIAYFQSYTNTYGDVKYLEKLFTDTISRPEIGILSIATRPDCLGKPVLEMLKRLNKIKPVWVELGLQTANEKSAMYIRRGYTNNVYENAVENLNAMGIKVVTHIIIGIPGETYEDMSTSVKYAVDCGTWGLKLQLLHVLRGTDLEAEYNNGVFNTLTLESYIAIITRLLTEIPPNIVIHRLTGDGDKKILVAPMWSADKKRVLAELSRELENKQVVQDSTSYVDN